MLFELRSNDLSGGAQLRKSPSTVDLLSALSCLDAARLPGAPVGDVVALEPTTEKTDLSQVLFLRW